MEVYFIRHGQTTSNAAATHAGWAPVELTDKGKKQAEETREILKNVVFDRIYVSDLVRTRQTADILFPDREWILESRMREHGVGILEYQKVSDCIEKYGQSYMDARTRDDFSAYQGETAEEMADRVNDFMKSLEQAAEEENSPEKAAVVCHAGSIYYALCYALGLRLPKKKILLSNCSVSKFRWEDGLWKVELWNVIGKIE